MLNTPAFQSKFPFLRSLPDSLSLSLTPLLTCLRSSVPSLVVCGHLHLHLALRNSTSLCYTHARP
jgi:hypothetical protein